MNMLTRNQFEKASAFIKANARRLDVSLFEYYFENGSAEKVIKELGEFQNEDGGFGQSIEPDFRLAISSPMATTIGLQYARELRMNSEHPLIKKAVTYLLESYDTEAKGWQGVPEAVNSVPHAPWWNYDVEKGHCGTHASWANPNAEITGYLREYSEGVPKPFLSFITKLALQELQDATIKMEMHDFLCFQRFAETLRDEEKEAAVSKLRKSAREITGHNAEDWQGYGLKPLQIVSGPSSAYSDLFKEEIPAQLDYEIDSLSKEGSWNPNWSWFGEFEEEWKIAEKDWKGQLTVKMLKTLNDFGRIETRNSM
ncbi:hypothetical protein [Peribacillus deserti]|uniref:Uncharacterized protein n=1 Tax=Peribacillus deserti TaxID=673318 RepID=A0A2N5M2V6_9BACI|nr:hypothetical protein [Peribacillus deserti]PLT28603.1 hypothetical protein CUU66_17700 [Peribacillus deserti]